MAEVNEITRAAFCQLAANILGHELSDGEKSRIREWVVVRGVRRDWAESREWADGLIHSYGISFPTHCMFDDVVDALDMIAHRIRLRQNARRAGRIGSGFSSTCVFEVWHIVDDEEETCEEEEGKQTFATMEEVKSYIEQALGEYVVDYDLDAIADDVTDVDERGRYCINVDDDEFWSVVERYDKTLSKSEPQRAAQDMIVTAAVKACIDSRGECDVMLNLVVGKYVYRLPLGVDAEELSAMIYNLRLNGYHVELFGEKGNLAVMVEHDDGEEN